MGFRFTQNGEKHGEILRIFARLMKFKPAILYPKNGKLSDDWYVHYEIFDERTGKYKVKKMRGDINRIKSLSEKRKYAKVLVWVINNDLLNGSDPEFMTSTTPQAPKSNDPTEQIRQMPIIEGLKWAFEKHSPNLAPKTKLDIRNVLNHVYKGIENTNFAHQTVGSFKKAHLRVVMEHIQQTKKISNNRYNTYIENIKGLYKAFVKYDVFDISPMTNMERIKEPEPKSFETLTPAERKLVYEHLLKVHPDFLVYFLLIYHTALRPKELVSIQIYNYNEEEQCFKIAPDETVILQGETHNKTKTNKTRYVPIPPEAMELLKKMKLNEYPSNYFIFSEGFKPGANNIERKRATEIWHKEIITHLGIPKKMYGAKHLGVDDKLKQGISIKAVQNQAGHTREVMTERYSKELKKIYQKEINEKSEGFLG